MVPVGVKQVRQSSRREECRESDIERERRKKWEKKVENSEEHLECDFLNIKMQAYQQNKYRKHVARSTHPTDTRKRMSTLPFGKGKS